MRPISARERKAHCRTAIGFYHCQNRLLEHDERRLSANVNRLVRGQTKPHISVCIVRSVYHHLDKLIDNPRSNTHSRIKLRGSFWLVYPHPTPGSPFVNPQPSMLFPFVRYPLRFLLYPLHLYRFIICEVMTGYSDDHEIARWDGHPV